MQSRTAAEEQIKSNIRRLVGAFYFVVLCRQAGRQTIKGSLKRGEGVQWDGQWDMQTSAAVKGSTAAPDSRPWAVVGHVRMPKRKAQTDRAYISPYIYIHISSIHISSIYICNEVGRQVGRIIMRSAPAKVFTFDCISFALWESITKSSLRRAQRRVYRVYTV